ncbi:hypothetical protein EYF80_049669 [Liparis tanakae]|uniref:Uncharacterized protein n=1 Tax=Liparis tanakae TaxID=230148 RepID=A0A4Z2FGW2_9TELE|nr:hypothetical protein EYF80_049669 [Liparis tanakae]
MKLLTETPRPPLRRPLTCLDGPRAAGARRAEGAPPAGRWRRRRRQRSVGEAPDAAGVAATRRRHRAAVGAVGGRGRAAGRAQQLGAGRPIGAQTGGGKVQRSRGHARRRRGRRRPGVRRRVGDVHVVAGEAVVGGAEARVGAEGEGGVRVGVGMRQRRRRHEALALHGGHGRGERRAVRRPVRLLAEEERQAVAVLHRALRGAAVVRAKLRLQLLFLHLLQGERQHAAGLVARFGEAPRAAAGVPLHFGLKAAQPPPPPPPPPPCSGAAFPPRGCSERALCLTAAGTFFARCLLVAEELVSLSRAAALSPANLRGAGASRLSWLISARSTFLTFLTFSTFSTFLTFLTFSELRRRSRSAAFPAVPREAFGPPPLPAAFASGDAPLAAAWLRLLACLAAE